MFIPDPRIRLFSIPDPGSDFFPSRIPDPNCLHPGSSSKNLSILIFNPKKAKKKGFWALKNMIRVFNPDPGSGCWLSPISDPGVKKAPNPGSRIRIRNTGFNIWKSIFHKSIATVSHRSYWAFASSLPYRWIDSFRKSIVRYWNRPRWVSKIDLKCIWKIYVAIEVRTCFHTTTSRLVYVLPSFEYLKWNSQYFERSWRSDFTGTVRSFPFTSNGTNTSVVL